MEAGKLKRPITIESQSETQDTYGQPSQTSWVTLHQTWAAINAVTSKEVYALGAGFTSQVTHKITVRFNPSIAVTAGMRIRYRGRIFIVQAVSDPDEQRVQLNLMCLEQSK